MAAVGVGWDALAVMGDDWPDLPLMARAAFACAPANAHAEAKALAHHVTQAAGGHGAARECCDLLLCAAGRYAGAAGRPPDDAGRHGVSDADDPSALDTSEIEPLGGLGPLLPDAGAPVGGRRAPWHVRAPALVAAYLPLLRAGAAGAGHAGGWCRTRAVDEPGAAPAAARHEPDYTMRGFTVQRYTAEGPLQGADRGRRAAPLSGHRHARDRRAAHPRARARRRHHRGQRAARAQQRRRQRGAAVRRGAGRARGRRGRAADAVQRRVPACLPAHRAGALAPAGGADARRDRAARQHAGVRQREPRRASCRAACTPPSRRPAAAPRAASAAGAGQ